MVWLQDEIHAEGVDVTLSTYATEADLASFDADHVILATGAEPRMDGLQMRCRELGECFGSRGGVYR